MDVYAFRLVPGQDLKAEIAGSVSREQLRAGCVLTCVGSLKKAVLRTTDERIMEFDGPFEIVSLVGTLCPDDVHLHLSVADKDGVVIGGHLKEGCVVHTTAEVVIGTFEGLSFTREHDGRTGFKELSIKRIS